MNKKHFDLIRQGVEVWNAWRRANLSEANLYKANLGRADLSAANLREADLRLANLRKANLRKADLSAANLREADLYKADLREANLYKADLSAADLRKADLSAANLRKADLSAANLREAIGVVRLQWEGFDVLVFNQGKEADIGCQSKPIIEWLALTDEQAIEMGAKPGQVELYRLFLKMAS